MLVVIAVVVLKSGERANEIRMPSSDEVADVPTQTDPINSSDVGQDDGSQTMSWEPDRDLNAAAEATDSEEPPRTVAGILPVKRSIELPVVDPATLPYDKNIGRIDISSVAQTGNSAPGEGSDSIFTSSTRAIETNDGPLAGRVAVPDPSVPGPGGIPVSGSTSNANDTDLGRALDPLGPGQPIDPGIAAATLRMASSGNSTSC